MKLNNDRGVTLLALVITIIVMFIIASVSIRFATNDAGILTQAVDVKEDYVKGEETEKIISSYLRCVTQGIDVTAETLENALNLDGQNVTVETNENDDTILEITFWDTNNIYTVDENMVVVRVN